MDQDLRRLDRARAKGDLESRARWLAAALRAGEIHRSRVELAAHLGDEAAVAVTGRAPPEDFVEWAAGIATWGKEAAVRASLAMARAARAPLDAPLVAALDAAARWLDERTEEAAMDASWRAAPWIESPARSYGARARRWATARGVGHAALIASLDCAWEIPLEVQARLLAIEHDPAALRAAVRDVADSVLVSGEPFGFMETLVPERPDDRRSRFEVDHLLPAIALGAVDDGTTPFAPLLHLEHQTGGYACSQHPMTGVLLPLEWNLDRLGAHPERLLWTLEALSHDPREPALVDEFLAFDDMTLTFGQECDPGQLEALDELLAEHAALPRLVHGVEAIVRFEQRPLLETFEGWRWAELVVPLGAHAMRRAWTFRPGVVDQALVAELEARALTHAYLLWLNTD